MKLIDFKKYSSIHIGSTYEVKIINKIDNYDDFTIIGKCNNTLVSPGTKKLAILGNEFDYIVQKDEKLLVGAATTSGKLLTYCKKNNIANFELLAKLPGNIGGLVKMNAGLKEYEIFNYLHSIKTQDGDFLKAEISHKYRHTEITGIIYEVSFDIQNGYCKETQDIFVHMRDNQPNLPSAGSCFKNPKNNSAGYLIEQVGLKGFTIGNMQFSSIHANFLVNLGDGTYNDAINLINIAKQKVKEKFDINLELEIIII